MSNVEPIYGSDLIVKILKQLGIEYVAFNPGATFRGLHDSLVNYGGNSKPEIIQCCHEEISVAIAHGYAKATGKPMVAVLHDVVGLQHASMAIFNAWCDHVPVLLLGGTGPMDTTRRRPTIDWIHSALVQGNQIRDYVKWDDQPHNIYSVPNSLLRAYITGITLPKGPVYVCLDIDVQENVIKSNKPVPEINTFSLPTSPGPDPCSLEQIAQYLCKAEFPVVVSDYIGREEKAVNKLQELAEMLSMPVMDAGKWHRSVIFPNNHPLDLTGAEDEMLERADLVLALDVEDLYGILHKTWNCEGRANPLIKTKSKVVQISLKELQRNSWVSTQQEFQPVDVSLTADPAIALPQLVVLCNKLLKSHGDNRREERFRELAHKHHRLRSEWLERAESDAAKHPIAVSWLAHQIWQEIKGKNWVLTNGTLKGWARKIWDWDTTKRFMGVSGGAGLGYGIGASVGVALAFRDTDKLCIDLQDDGDFLFAPSALWTAAHYKLPLLIIINNNRSYNNSERHQAQVAMSRNRDLKNAKIGTQLDNPEIDYTMLARSFGLHAEGPVTDPGKIAETIRRAIDVVLNDRRPVLVDVVTAD